MYYNQNTNINVILNVYSKINISTKNVIYYAHFEMHISTKIQIISVKIEM